LFSFLNLQQFFQIKKYFMAKEEKAEMSFMEHLEELRWHIIRSILAITVTFTIAFVFRQFIFDQIILAPKNPEFITNSFFCSLAQKWHTESLCINQKKMQLINITMAGQFNTHMKISLVLGLILAFPYIFYEFWKFVAPALYPKERKVARGTVFATAFLFLLGVLFGYFILIPLSIHFLNTYIVSEQVINQINLMSYISTISMLALASGITFELPMLMYFLTKIGIISPSFLRKYRRHAIIVIFIIAAIITPPDVFSQTLVALPLLLLYEIGIFISAAVYKKKQEAAV